MSSPRRIRGLLAASLAVLIVPPLASSAAPERRPNVLILVGDDHRGGTLGVDGDPRKATPNLDALARQGSRFTRAYCNAPVCTPSRQSFITGRLPHAVGVTVLSTPLPEDAVTLGVWLQKQGYQTAALGKMHFNGPSHHGFETRLDLPDWNAWLRKNPPEGGDKRRPWHPFVDPAARWLNADCLPEGLPADSMNTTYFADRAIDYMRAHRDEPFALVVGFNEPHSPFRFPREWAGRYNPADFPRPSMNDEDERVRPVVFRELAPDDAQSIQAAYYSSLSFLDNQIGRVVAALDEMGLAEDTIVVYMGDNGYMLGEHGRFEKHCFYEPAVRVPFLIRWKDHLPAGREIVPMVEFVDLFPTLVDLLGVSAPDHLQGQSLTPLLRGEPDARGREWVFSEYLENEEAMVRDGRYKLIVGTGRRRRLDGYHTDLPLTGPYERLFDTQTDPEENTDLSEKPDLATVKEQLLDRLYERLTTTRNRSASFPQIPQGFSRMETIHWCLVPRDRTPAKPAK